MAAIDTHAAPARGWLDVLAQRPVHSSATLGWRHLEAHRFNGLSCRELELPAVPRHFISSHLFKPCQVDTRWHGRRHHSQSLPGNAMVMSAGQHSSWHCDAAIDELLVFLDPLIVDEVAEEVVGHRCALVDGVGLLDPAICEISRQLLVEIEQPGVGTRLFADTMARTLALQLVRSHSTATRIALRRPEGLSTRQLRAAVEYIESHLAEDLSLDRISAAPAMSPFRFARAFRAATGLSPRQFVIVRRIERAKELLRATQRDLAEIANLVGFSTHSHFSSVFRRRVGTTPKRFRDQANT